MVNIKVVPLTGDDAIKWLVLEGSSDTCPQATQRVTVDTAGLASGVVTLETIKAQLTAAVEDAATRYLAVQEALKSL